MSRLNEWLDTERSKRIDYNTVISDQETQVKVYRTISTSNGFSNEITEASYLKRLYCRVDRTGSKSYNQALSEAGKSTVYDLMATTLDKDVKINDRWVLLNKNYRVTAIDDLDDVRTEVSLIEYRDEDNI